jgi:hypothetical protein
LRIVDSPRTGQAARLPQINAVSPKPFVPSN